jgi:hypothetical protein
MTIIPKRHRRPLAVLQALVLALGLLVLVPGSANADQTSYYKSQQTFGVCYGTGGSYGHGHEGGYAAGFEYGVSGTNFIQLQFVKQRWTLYPDGVYRWKTVYAGPRHNTAYFVNDGANHGGSWSTVLNWSSADVGSYVRTASYVRWYKGVPNDGYADTLLHQHFLAGNYCKSY